MRISRAGFFRSTTKRTYTATPLSFFRARIKHTDSNKSSLLLTRFRFVSNEAQRQSFQFSQAFNTISSHLPNPKREEKPVFPAKLNSSGWPGKEHSDPRVIGCKIKHSGINPQYHDSCAWPQIGNNRRNRDAEPSMREYARQAEWTDLPQTPAALYEETADPGASIGKSEVLENSAAANPKSSNSPRQAAPFESLLGEILPPVSQQMSKKALTLLIMDLAKDQDLSTKERHRYVKALIRLLLKRGSLKPRDSRATSPPLESKPAT